VNKHQTLILGLIFGMVIGAAIPLAFLAHPGYTVCIFAAIIALVMTTILD
jgi:hypothetical protein